MLRSTVAVLLVLCLSTPMPGQDADAKLTSDGAGSSSWTPRARTDPKGIEQVYAPAGCFIMGGSGGRDHGPPAHEVCITQPFWIDTYEVTNEAFRRFIDAGGYSTREYWSAAGWDGKGSKTRPRDKDGFAGARQPRVGVTWYEAQAYASWRGCRLPTEAEWEYAARGPESLAYPWGNAFDGTLQNYCDTNCEYDHRDPTADDGFARTAPVGSYPDGASWIGAHDLTGNVWEWVADWYGPDYHRRSPRDDPQGPESGQLRVLRGGCWSSNRADALATYLGSPNNRNATSGFRVVCGDPASSTRQGRRAG